MAVGCLAVLVAWLPLALFGEQAYGVALECAALVKDDVTLTVFFRARRTLVGLAWPDVPPKGVLIGPRRGVNWPLKGVNWPQKGMLIGPKRGC